MEGPLKTCSTYWQNSANNVDKSVYCQSNSGVFMSDSSIVICTICQASVLTRVIVPYMVLSQFYTTSMCIKSSISSVIIKKFRCRP